MAILVNLNLQMQQNTYYVVLFLNIIKLRYSYRSHIFILFPNEMSSLELKMQQICYCFIFLNQKTEFDKRKSPHSMLNM